MSGYAVSETGESAIPLSARGGHRYSRTGNQGGFPETQALDASRHSSCRNDSCSLRGRLEGNDKCPSKVTSSAKAEPANRAKFLQRAPVPANALGAVVGPPG